MTDEATGKEELRIGVFICYCGSNIGGYVDVPAVAELTKTLPDVVHVEDRMYTCAEDSLIAIKEAIKDHGLNRVVVASCTPRTHAPLFQNTCEAAGLNKYLFTFVNIREQCSWVHMEKKEEATEKAKELVKMGVARVKLLEPQEEVKISVKPVSVVIGGGVSGLTAALNLAKQGFETHIIEKETTLGGFIKDMGTLWEGGTPQSHIEPLIAEVNGNNKIKVHLGSEVDTVDGHIGNFQIRTKTGDTIEAGTIILAIGAQELKPTGIYGYEKIRNVITLADFERKEDLKDVKDVAFIQCAGARGQKVEYCSRICCNVAIKAAIHLVDKLAETGAPKEGEVMAAKEEPSAEGGQRKRRSRRRRDATGPSEGRPSSPSGGTRANITIFNRTINAYGVHHEMYYNKAREKRIKFVKYDLDNPPKISEDGTKVKIEYFAEALGGWRDTTVDIVVLSTPLVAHDDAERLGQAMKIPRGPDGFFLEAHVKLRPVEFATDGIFLAGTCRAPADITEAVLQANAAASRAAIPMANGNVQAEALSAKVEQELCTGCGTCLTVCAFNAIQIVDGKAGIIEAACKGCGACASICTERAIIMNHFSDDQILNEAMSALEEVRQ